MITKLGKISVEKPKNSILFDLYFDGTKIGQITPNYMHIGAIGLSLTPEETINLGIIYHECLKWFNETKPHERSNKVITNFCGVSDFKINKFQIE